MAEEMTLARLQADFERLQEDYQALEGLFNEQSTALQTAEGRIKELEPLEGRAKELEAKVTERDTLDQAAELAKELGIDPARVKAALKLTEGGEYRDLRERLTKATEENDFLKAPATDAKPSKLPPDENGARGVGSGNTGKFRATNAQLNDPDWMERNMAKIAEASLEGTFEMGD